MNKTFPGWKGSTRGCSWPQQEEISEISEILKYSLPALLRVWSLQHPGHVGNGGLRNSGGADPEIPVDNSMLQMELPAGIIHLPGLGASKTSGDPTVPFFIPPKKNHPGLLVPPTSPCRFWAGSLISMRLIAVIGRLAVGVGAAGMFSGRGEDAPAVILVAGLWFCVQRAPRNPKVSPWFRLKTHPRGVEMLISAR